MIQWNSGTPRQSLLTFHCAVLKLLMVQTPVLLIIQLHCPNSMHHFKAWHLYVFYLYIDIIVKLRLFKVLKLGTDGQKLAILLYLELL